jgi:hypothetical protein
VPGSKVNGNGTFIYTNAVNPGTNQLFFRVRMH